MTKKLYCYVDETGQDTKGTLFIVTVVIPKNKDEVLAYLEQVEKNSGKEKFKWGKADPRKRKRYLTEILTQKKYPLIVYYSVYGGSKTYKHATILSIAKAITSIQTRSIRTLSPMEFSYRCNQRKPPFRGEQPSQTHCYLFDSPPIRPVFGCDLV